MRRRLFTAWPLLALTWGLQAAPGWAEQTKDFNPASPINPPGRIYWCPDKPLDRQYVSTPQPGCSPLVEEEKPEAKPEKKAGTKARPPKERPPLTTREIQGQVAVFLQEYRDFMNCCATSATLEDVEDLEQHATHILKFVQDSGFVNMGTAWRGITLSQLIPPVARAREDLRKLKTRLRKLDEAYDRAVSGDFEGAARERRKIQEEEVAIQRDSRRTPPPQSAPTGTDIGGPGTTQGPPATTLPNRVGTTIEQTTTPTTLPSATGADIGTVVSPDDPYQQRSLGPRAGPRSGSTNLPTNVGTSPTDETTLSNTTGFEVGAPEGPTGSSSLPSRAGPSIGESSLNRR